MSKGYVKEMTDVKNLKNIKEVFQRDDRCKKIEGFQRGVSKR